MSETGSRTQACAPPCSMREACARASLDRGGARCPACPVRDLCQNETRWVVRAGPPH